MSKIEDALRGLLDQLESDAEAGFPPTAHANREIASARRALEEPAPVEAVRWYHEFQRADAARQRAMGVLTGIYDLLNPPRIEANGKTYEFRDPNVPASERWQLLSDRIRKISDLASPPPGVAPRVEGGKGASGHYLRIERGEWVHRQGTAKQEYPASGWAYIGSLTREESEEIGTFVDDLMRRKQSGPTTPHVPAAAPPAADARDAARWRHRVEQLRREFGETMVQDFIAREDAAMSAASQDREAE